MKLYTIQHGTFRQADGTLANAGDTIELEDDVAAMHAGQLVEAAPANAAPAPAPKRVQAAAP